jgi:hypothetical protein
VRLASAAIILAACHAPPPAAPPPQTAQSEPTSEGPTDIPPLPPPPYAKTTLPAFDALREATSIELFRLDPDVQVGANVERRFHDYFVVASGTGHAPAPIISTLVTAAERGGPTSDCFLPQHGVRVRTPSATYDLVISLRCHQTEVYEGDHAMAMLATEDLTTAMDKAFAANGL